jgi:hypothetical protein
MGEPAPRETPILAAALAYGASGWPVFPLHTPDQAGRCDCGNRECDSPGKHPWTAHGLKDASRDELTIRRWWRQWPDANIGLPMPHGYVAVDVDGEDGERALAEAGYALPQTAIARTGRGFHYIYRSAVKIPPKVGFLTHVDLRGPGSYIVAPPSKHASGRMYAWVRPLDKPADAPPWLTARPAQTESVLRDRFDTAAALQGVAVGDRDNALFRLASKLRYADVPYELAERLVLEAAAQCSPPFPERDALQKVQGAFHRYQPTVVNTPAGYSVEVTAADAVTVTATSLKGPVELAFTEMEKSSHALDASIRIRMLLPGNDSEPYLQRLNLLSMSAREACRRELDAVFGKEPGWSSILARSATRASDAFLSIDRAIRAAEIAAPSRMEFLIEHMVPDEGVTILFGAGSASKTYQAMLMAVCVALGLPWLGRPTQQRNVLWIDYETGGPMFGYRLGRVLAALGLTREQVPNIYYWGAEGVPLSDQVPGLLRAIERHNIGFAVLDHAALACGGEPEKSDSALRFYRATGKLGLPLLTIAHVTGDGERDPELVQRPFGSVFWSNGARRTWFIQRQQEQESSVASVGFYCRKVNDGAKPADFGVNVFFEEDGGPVHVLAADLRLTPQLNQTRGVEYQIHAALDHPMTYVEIAEAIGNTAEYVRKRIAKHPRLFERAEETRTDGGRGVVTRWQRAPVQQNPDTRTRPIEKKEVSGFTGDAAPPVKNPDLETRINPDMYPGLEADEVAF